MMLKLVACCFKYIEYEYESILFAAILGGVDLLAFALSIRHFGGKSIILFIFLRRSVQIQCLVYFVAMSINNDNDW